MSAAKLIFLALTCLPVNWFGVKRSQGSKEWLDYKEMNSENKRLCETKGKEYEYI